MKQLASIYLRFRLIIISYFVIVVLWLLLFISKGFTGPWFEANFGAGFLISYLASLLEDIIFFGTIGIFGLALSTKLPEDEDINVRVKSLANNKNVGDGAKKYLIEHISKILAYNSTAEVSLILKEYDKESKTIMLYTEIKNEVINMCKDVKYSSVDTVFMVEPNVCFKGNYGYISYLGVNDIKSEESKKIVDGEILELKNANPYLKPVEFNISEDSSAIWRMCFATYGKLDTGKENLANWYFIKVEKFTENFNIKVSNTTDTPIVCDIFYINRNEINTNKKINQENILINPNSEKILNSNIVFYPLDAYYIYFHS